jgi:hypothetical protein
MRITWFTRIAGLGLAMAAMFTPPMKAQTVTISNERLVSTTFVVNRTSSFTACHGKDCTAPLVRMFKAIEVTCPAAIGKTCTLHIALDAKTGISPFARDMYQFLLDGSAPVPGPTDDDGFYIYAVRDTQTDGGDPQERQSAPASVVGRVKNLKSKNHKIQVRLTCTATTSDCGVAAYRSTMRIDVFEP